MDAAHVHRLGFEHIADAHPRPSRVDEFIQIADQQPAALATQVLQMLVVDLPLAVLAAVVVEGHDASADEVLERAQEVIRAVVVDQVDRCGSFSEVVLDPLSEHVALVLEQGQHQKLVLLPQPGGCQAAAVFLQQP